MRILRDLPSFPPELRPSVAAFGAFDGIHLAHAKILDTAVARARALSVRAVACTFDPHPTAVLSPERAPAPIGTLEENLVRIAERGLDATLVIPFTRDFSRMEAETFVDEILVETLGVREVVVGFNHTFGRGARGTAVLLRELGSRRDFVTHVLPPLQVNGLTVSSSVIREALREGDVELAAGLLGRPYSVTGTVQRGAGRGRSLGFPTANLKPDRPLTLAGGVYAARARWEERQADAVVNIGFRPTFEESEYWIEAHLFDFSSDIYDRTLTLDFRYRIRPEMKFPGIDALKAQVHADMQEARRLLRGSPGPPPAG